LRACVRVLCVRGNIIAGVLSIVLVSAIWLTHVNVMHAFRSSIKIVGVSGYLCNVYVAAHRHTDKQTHTDTQTHRHTDTQTHRHTDTQTHRHTDTHRHTQTHRHTDTHRHTETETETDTQTQTHRLTDADSPRREPLHAAIRL
jgi:hypothetical protein